MSIPDASARPITLYYNNQPAQFHLKSCLICPDGKELNIDSNRNICHIMDVEITGRGPKRVVLYEDTAEEIQKRKNDEVLINQVWLDFVKELCPDVTDENELKVIAEKLNVKGMDSYKKTENIIKQRNIEEERQRKRLQPRSRWIYLADGFMAIGALFIAFKVVEFVVKKKPELMFYSIYSAIKNVVIG